MKEHFDTVQVLGLNDDCHETQYFTRYDAIGPAKNLMKRLSLTATQVSLRKT